MRTKQFSVDLSGNSSKNLPGFQYKETLSKNALSIQHVCNTLQLPEEVRRRHHFHKVLQLEAFAVQRQPGDGAFKAEDFLPMIPGYPRISQVYVWTSGSLLFSTYINLII